MNNPNDVTKIKHLDSLANALVGKTGGNVFTGATSIAGGISGFVLAPAIDARDKFLRGDGTWATVGGGQFTLDTVHKDEGKTSVDFANLSSPLRVCYDNSTYGF